jgi:hypothetical protein
MDEDTLFICLFPFLPIMPWLIIRIIMEIWIIIHPIS